MRGVSLDEIVATTKISRRLLQALENEQFDLLPGGIFNRSYVRAYAKCVGLDEEEAVAEYQAAAQETPPDTRVIAQQHASIHSDRPRERSGFPLVPVLILLVVAAGGIGAWKMYQERQREREQSMAHTSSAAPSTVPAEATPVADASAAPSSRTASGQQGEAQKTSSGNPALQTANTSGDSTSAAVAGGPARASQPPAGADEATGSSFEVTVRPKDRAWVSIKADGKIVVRGIIEPPDVKTIHAANQIIFYTGNAGAVEVAFEGKDVPVTGGANDQLTLVFDAHGLLPKVPAP